MGCDWLIMQGCRNVLRRHQHRGDNDFLDNVEADFHSKVQTKHEVEHLMGAGRRTLVHADATGSTISQQNLRANKEAEAVAAAFEPSRMVYYVMGRPCVVPKLPQQGVVCMIAGGVHWVSCPLYFCQPQ